MSRLRRDRTILVVIDVQERLTPAIDGIALLVQNVERLIRGCRILGVAVLVTEQYPKGLGATIPVLRTVLAETTGYDPIEKECFSAQGCAAFEETLRGSGRTQVLLAGVEAHVCVYQTASDLLTAGFDVTLVSDAVSSRDPRNRDVAVERMLRDGANLSSTEMALFELLGTSTSDEFRAISKLVK